MELVYNTLVLQCKVQKSGEVKGGMQEETVKNIHNGRSKETLLPAKWVLDFSSCVTRPDQAGFWAHLCCKFVIYAIRLLILPAAFLNCYQEPSHEISFSPADSGGKEEYHCRSTSGFSRE